MPKLNGTGPLGRGPKTGRQLGICQGNIEQKSFSPKNELAILEEKEKRLESELAATKKEKASLKDKKT